MIDIPPGTKTQRITVSVFWNKDAGWYSTVSPWEELNNFNAGYGDFAGDIRGTVIVPDTEDTFSPKGSTQVDRMSPEEFKRRIFLLTEDFTKVRFKTREDSKQTQQPDIEDESNE